MELIDKSPNKYLPKKASLKKGIKYHTGVNHCSDKLCREKESGLQMTYARNLQNVYHTK